MAASRGLPSFLYSFRVASIHGVPANGRAETRTVAMADLKTIDVLVPRPTMPLIVDGLMAAFRGHRLWEAADEDAWIATNGASVRGIAGNFHAKAMDAAFLSRFPNLEIVGNFGVGYDSVDAAWCAGRGIVVTNTPDVLTDEVADLAMGLLLATVRQLPQADAYLRRGEWLKAAFPLTSTLRGRKMGILGLGRIGKGIARRAEAFGLEIHYHGRSRQTDVSYTYHATLVGMAEAVDVLMSVAPGGADTYRLIGPAVLQALGKDGILINVGRGSVVDEPALVEALKAGTILTAGLDVFEDEPRVPAELVAMPHVVLLPHVGSASHHTRRLMGQLVVDNLVAWFEGRGPLTPVPETPWKT
jgi:lactate dehydrogenase-like 2-hydroxyacid dehydrogenase